MTKATREQVTGALLAALEYYWGDRHGLAEGEPRTWTECKKDAGLLVNMASKYAVSYEKPESEPPTLEDAEALYERHLEERRQYPSMSPSGRAPRVPKGEKGANPLLAQFHACELIDELKSRGYKGELQYVFKINL